MVHVSTLLKKVRPVRDVSWDRSSGMGAVMSMLLRSRREGRPVEGSHVTPAHPSETPSPQAWVEDVHVDNVTPSFHNLALRVRSNCSQPPGAVERVADFGKRATHGLPSPVLEEETTGEAGFHTKGRNPHRLGL